MSLVVFENVGISFGKKTIVSDLGLRIGNDDRIGVVGPNGSGKTTILRVIAGDQGIDAGEVRCSNQLRVGYLPQDIAVEGGRSLMAFVMEAVPGRGKLETQIQTAEEELAARSEAEDLEGTMEVATRLSELHEEKLRIDTLYGEHDAHRILAGLGFAEGDRGRDLSEFSGGWKMRAVLAALLFQKPDLLLLDEPTNHLDMPSVAWFSAFLRRYSGAFLLICHDREFLNEQINRVVTFEPEGVRQYVGNLDSYEKQREEEREILENQAKNQAKKKEQLERFVDRFRAKASKASAVQSRVKMLDKMGNVETHGSRAVMRFTFPTAARAGNEVLTVKNLGKRYDAHTVFEDVNLQVQRGDRIGIIGVNGAGKTTLLRIMANELEASAGEVEQGHNVKLGYYAQHHADVLDKKKTIFEEVSGHSKDAGITRVRTLLGAFLFSGDDVNKHIKVLSGGERARVALAKMLVEPGNVILMDEPTNHLDLDSSEALAEALATFDGTLMFVSHNRSFVRRLATKIWDVSSGRVETYPGTLDEYLFKNQGDDEEASGPGSRKASGNKSKNKKDPVEAPEPQPAAAESKQVREQRKKQEAKRRQERSRRIRPLEKKAEELEGRIAELEQAQAERSKKLESPEAYGDDEARFKLLSDLQADQEKLDELTERWSTVQEELEATRAQLDSEG